MGAIANRTQGQSLQAMNPQRELKVMLEKSWPHIKAVMVNETSSERLYQMYVSTINKEPQLADCSFESVLSCFMQCTALGLEPSNVNGLGMAYILPFMNKHYTNGKRDATLLIGYKGMIELARRSGELKSIHATAVYEGDEYSTWEDETGQHFKYVAKRGVPHTPDKLTDVFVNAQLMNGGFVFETMTKAEVEQVKQRSPSAKASSTPWKSDYEAMALKTVIRRSFKYLPVSVEAKRAAVVDETTPDYSDVFHPVVSNDVEDMQNNTVEATVDEEPTVSVQPETDERDQRVQAIFNGYRAIGIDGADMKKAIETIIGHEFTSSDEWTPAEIDVIAEDLGKGVKDAAGNQDS